MLFALIENPILQMRFIFSHTLTFGRYRIKFSSLAILPVQLRSQRVLHASKQIPGTQSLRPFHSNCCLYKGFATNCWLSTLMISFFRNTTAISEGEGKKLYTFFFHWLDKLINRWVNNKLFNRLALCCDKIWVGKNLKLWWRMRKLAEL